MRCARNGFREFCSRRAAPHTPSRDSVTLSDPLPPILWLLFGRFPPLAAETARQAHRCEQWEAQRTATAAPELNARSPVPPGNCCMHSRPGPANTVWFVVLGTHNGSTIVASRHWHQPVLCCAFACTATNAPELTRAPWCVQTAVVSIQRLWLHTRCNLTVQATAMALYPLHRATRMGPCHWGGTRHVQRTAIFCIY